MLGWGKKSDPTTPTANGPSGKRGEPIIAALLLEGDTFDIGAMEKALRQSKPGGRSPTDIDSRRGSLIFELGDELYAIAPMPAPYPWSSLKGPCETLWMWPAQASASVLKKHRTFVLITAIKGQGSPIERRLAFTQVVAIAGKIPGVLGIYWAEATQVYYPPIFVQIAEEITDPAAPPLYLWVDYRIFRNQDGSLGMFTTGIRPLGFMEMEIPRIEMEPAELREWAISLTLYFLENGSKIKDGDTIGVSADHQIRVRHRPSSFGAKGTVLHFES